jgi:Protein of unknown function (DUF3147)
VRNSSVAWGGIRALVHLAEITMQIKVDPTVIGQTRWYEYAIRFLFGGLITAVAGIIAKKFGAGIGGLFLAFPAIFPASATLIEKHEKQKKEEKGLRGTRRGGEAASVEAAGSAMGSIGLFVFALLVWRLLSDHRSWIVLTGASLAWLAVSVLIWQIRKRV